MDTLLDLLQALGIGAAIGIRPFIPALLVGALAAGNFGVNFTGTDYAFLERTPFLLIMLVALVVFDFVRRRGGDDAFDAGPTFLIAGVVSVVIAALEGAGSLADHGRSVVAGLAVAVLGAVLALVALRPLFIRVRTRLGTEAGLLPFYREAAGLVAAFFSVLFPPLAILIVGGLLFLLTGGQRREGEKYAGLRILR